MAMTLAVLGLAQAYADMGISNALVYRQDTTRAELSSLYWLNIFAGLVVFSLAILTAPLISTAFGEPRIRDLLMLGACVFLIVPIGQQFQVLLQKNLRFRVLAVTEIAAAFVGAAAAIVAALLGHGVYALIWGYLALAVIKAFLLASLGWREWGPSLRFRRSDIGGYLSFGLYQMGERTITYLNSRLDQVLIGGLLGAQALGYYHLAHMLVMQPVMRLNPMVTKVAFPVFAKLQTDQDALKGGYLLMLRVLTAVNCPLLFGLAVVAGWFVPIVFGPQWLPAVALVQVLSAVGLLRSAGNPIGALLLARGRADLGFQWNAVAMCVTVPSLVLGASLGGVMGVALALLAVQILRSVGVYHFLVRRQLGPCLGSYLDCMAPAFFLSGLMAVLVLGLMSLSREPGPISLGLVVLAGGAIYVALYYLLQREHFLNLKDMILRA